MTPVRETGRLWLWVFALVLACSPAVFAAGIGVQATSGGASDVVGPQQSPTAPAGTAEGSRWPSSAPQTDAASQPEAAASQPDSAALQRQRQLQVFGPILHNPSRDIDPVTRRNAAQELLDMRAADASGLLDDAIRSRKSAVMLAALEVLQTAPVEVLAEFQDACMSAIVEAPKETIDALAMVLSRMGTPALDGLSALALSTNVPEAARLGPIAALGYFRNRTAAGHLISLLSVRTINLPTPGQPLPESLIITNAACASLQRLTGIPLGSQHDQWRRWWTVAKDLPPDQWFQAMAESLGDRVAELEARLRKSQETTDALSKQVFETYRELYPALPVEEQLRRLPRLLEDPSPPVRLFALSRVNLLLRDSVRINPELQQKVADRMDDEVPELRAQTCRLLDELNYEGLSPLVADHLQTERSPVAAGALLEIVQKRPEPSLLEPTRAWLGSPELCDRAADATWAILITGEPDANALVQTRAALLHTAPDQHTAAELRVLAYIGDDADMSALEAALDGDDASRKAAVAEGFARRGVRQRLMDRADDSVVYPFALRSLINGVPDFANFSAIVGLKPPPDQLATWAQVVRDAAGALPVEALIEVDDLLIETSWADAALRRSILARAAVPATPPLPPNVQIELVRRLATLMMDAGDAAQAFELLQSVTLSSAIEPLQEVRFKAAALTGHYEQATELQRDPAAWIVLVQSLAARDPEAAAALRDEITRRFADELTQQQRGDLEQVSRSFDDETTAAANAPAVKAP